MCSVCSSGDVQTKFCLMPRFLNHVSCYSFNGWCDPFLQVLDIPYLLSIHNVLNVLPTGKNHAERDLGFKVARFPDAWIGRGGPIPWPPRSPGLSPLEFFLWGYIKNIVYAEKIRNTQHLQERITSAIETVTRDMIQKTWQETEFRLDVSRATNVHILKCSEVSLRP